MFLYLFFCVKQDAKRVNNKERNKKERKKHYSTTNVSGNFMFAIHTTMVFALINVLQFSIVVGNCQQMAA